MQTIEVNAKAGSLPTVLAAAALPLIAVAASTFSFAQAAPLSLLLLALMGVREAGIADTTARIRAEFWAGRGLLNLAVVATILLALLATVSGLWAPSLLNASMKGLGLAIILVAALAGSGVFSADGSSRRQAIASGLIIGLSIALLLVAVNVLTADWLTRKLFTLAPLLAASIAKHVTFADGVAVAVSDSVGNRPMAVATLLLVPGMIIARRLHRSLLRNAFFFCVAIYVAAVLLNARHQSSQLAIVVGASVLLMAWLNVNITRRIVLVTWCVGVMAAPLVGALALKLEVHQASWLFSTARQRVIIWGTTAERIAERPILGHGAAAAEVLQKSTPRPAVRDGEVFARTTARHAHNAYLQIWLDLGLVGALLLTAIGAALVQRTAQLLAGDQAWALAAFAVGVAMMASSYGMWQAWIQASLGLALALAAAAMALRPPDTDAPSAICLGSQT